MKIKKVLSVFDGISCGRQALLQAGFQIEKYYASEVDPYPMKIAMRRFPDTVQLGDIINLDPDSLEDIDALFGGSPCQGFSKVGKKLNFDDPRSRLFFEFVRIKNALQKRNPKLIFLFENVELDDDIQDIISEMLGVEPILINSSLVSGQSRPRLYWTNIPGVTLPKNRNIMLADCLIDDAPAELDHSERAIAYMNRFSKGRQKWSFGLHSDSKKPKSACLTANLRKGIPYNVLVHKDRVRKFAIAELERLQGLPVGYTEGVSDTQKMKAIGNGWQVDTIVHILSFYNAE